MNTAEKRQSLDPSTTNRDSAAAADATNTGSGVKISKKVGVGLDPVASTAADKKTTITSEPPSASKPGMNFSKISISQAGQPASQILTQTNVFLHCCDDSSNNVRNKAKAIKFVCHTFLCTTSCKFVPRSLQIVDLHRRRPPCNCL